MRREGRHLVAKRAVIHAVTGDQEQRLALAAHLEIGAQTVGGHEGHASILVFGYDAAARMQSAGRKPILSAVPATGMAWSRFCSTQITVRPEPSRMA